MQNLHTLEKPQLNAAPEHKLRLESRRGTLESVRHGFSSPLVGDPANQNRQECPCHVYILGGGPAGSSAAIAARQEGRDVCLIEKSKFPRHKVCGEFLTPEIVPLLESLAVWDAFLAAGPARVRRLELHFGSFDRISNLPETA